LVKNMTDVLALIGDGRQTRDQSIRQTEGADNMQILWRIVAESPDRGAIGHLCLRGQDLSEFALLGCRRSQVIALIRKETIFLEVVFSLVRNPRRQFVV